MMNNPSAIQILPYSLLVGQKDVRLALELAYIAPRIGGVLISGQRGTAKSTAVRAFAQMMYNGQLPVTLPLNATEDRVVGGWKIDELMRGRAREQRGLLEEANNRMLYVDEVNLLEDHIVNIILDVASTGVLVVQREGRREQKPVSFTLVGTMNPEEGWLRPQLRDRFGLMVAARTESEHRKAILDTVLEFDKALFLLRNSNELSAWLKEGRDADAEHFKKINSARERLVEVEDSPEIAALCVRLADEFKVEGHRGEYALALAARACAAREAAIDGVNTKVSVTKAHVQQVARLALQHRRPQAAQGQQKLWDPEKDDPLVVSKLNEPAPVPAMRPVQTASKLVVGGPDG